MTTLTLKNIPDELHAQLKESAERNRRSLNSEILVPGIAVERFLVLLERPLDFTVLLVA